MSGDRKELVSLLRRAAAALETGGLSADEYEALIEDLDVAADRMDPDLAPPISAPPRMTENATMRALEIVAGYYTRPHEFRHQLNELRSRGINMIFHSTNGVESSITVSHSGGHFEFTTGHEFLDSFIADAFSKADVISALLHICHGVRDGEWTESPLAIAREVEVLTWWCGNGPKKEKGSD